MKYTRWVFIPSLIFSFLAISEKASPGPSLLEIRYWTAPDHTRIVLDLTGKPRYKESFLPAPPRIVIEIENAAPRPGEKRKEVKDGVVKSVELNELPGNRLQAVIELEREASHKVFALSGIGDKPERIVVDVARVVSPEKKKEEQVLAISLKKKKTKIVVVDPGHGGEDPGAVGYGKLREKDVCFEIAKKTRDEINRIPGYKAYLTRDGDYFLPLRRRIAVARERQADVFLSIHANATKSKKGRGTEIYFLSLTGATDEAARELARLENAADQIGGVPEEADEDLVSILYDLRQTDTLRRSSGLAESVGDNVKSHRKLITRGVRQAGFTVLKSPAIPSILVETAFITDKREAGFLKDSRFQSEFARLLARGVSSYFQRFGPEASRPAVHIVQKGESLKDIAGTYGVSVAELMSFNNLQDGASVRAGQEIVVFP